MSRYSHPRRLPLSHRKMQTGEGRPHAPRHATPRHECRPCQSHSPGSALRVSRLARLMGQLATRRSSACLSRSAIFSPGWISGPLSEHAEHQTVQAQSRVVGVPRLCSLPGQCHVKLTSCVVSQTLCLLPELSVLPWSLCATSDTPHADSN